jgi:FG-GAP-like repeat
MTRSRLGTSRLNTKSFVLIVLRRSVAVVSLLTVVAVTAMAQNPVPFIDQPLVPDATAPGSAGFTLTVNGAGFLTTSVVNWNGSPRATSFVSRSRLTATILATDIATASTAAVTVVNPSPGGGTSVPQFFSISVPVGSVSFLPAVAYAAGAGCANSVAVADVDGDGKPDLVVALGCRLGSIGLVTVMLGNGDGTFQAAVTYSSGGANASSVAVADVNGDGKPDLVLANGCTYGADCPLGGVVGVLLGNGDGTFQAALTFNSGGDGSSGSYLAIADVNGDGKPDLGNP